MESWDNRMPTLTLGEGIQLTHRTAYDPEPPNVPNPRLAGVTWDTPGVSAAVYRAMARVGSHDVEGYPTGVGAADGADTVQSADDLDRPADDDAEPAEHWHVAGSPVERRVAFHLADDDSGVFYGWSDGTTWNGFDNVTVSRSERDRIVATLTTLWRAETRNGSVGFYALEDALSGIDELPVMANGRVDLGWGYCTRIIGTAE